jgi:hypothetical protein
MIVEFSLILPLFLLLIFGVLAFGRYASRKAVVDQALREAGRYSSMLEGDCLTPAKNRFFARMSGTGFESGLILQESILHLQDGKQAVQLDVRAEKDDFLPFGQPVHSTGLFPVEVPDSCSSPTSLAAAAGSLTTTQASGSP